MSNENYIKLKKSSMQRIPFDLYAKDFSFIVNGEEYRTNRLFADILSPTISQLHSVDPTIDRFTINTQSTGDFSKVLNLVNFERATLSQDDYSFIAEIVNKLNMSTIRIHIEEYQGELTKEKAIQNIQKYENNDLFHFTILDRSIEFIASHFYELEEEQINQLKTFRKSSIQSIISHSNLRIENEDQLLKFVSELCDNDDDEYSIMYEYIQFVNVTSEMIKIFCYNFDYNQLTKPIWDRISDRLQREIVKTNEDHENKNKARYSTSNTNESKEGIKIESNNDKNFDGIINYIKNQTNNNVFEKLSITPSTLYSSSYPATNLLNNNPSQYYGTQNQPNSWICFDFKEYRVKLTHYKIQTNNGGCNMCNWKLEGSTDNKTWESLDVQTDCEHTHGDNKIHTFQINKNQNKEFQYIRLFSTGPNWSGSNYFVLSAIDFYGTLI